MSAVSKCLVFWDVENCFTEAVTETIKLLKKHLSDNELILNNQEIVIFAAYQQTSISSYQQKELIQNNVWAMGDPTIKREIADHRLKGVVGQSVRIGTLVAGDVAVIISGDSDFTSECAYLSDMGITSVVYGNENASALKRVSDKFFLWNPFSLSRHHVSKVRTEVCISSFKCSDCSYGSRCRFAHIGTDDYKFENMTLCRYDGACWEINKCRFPHSCESKKDFESRVSSRGFSSDEVLEDLNKRPMETNIYNYLKVM
jgi:hypothetical protein